MDNDTETIIADVLVQSLSAYIMVVRFKDVEHAGPWNHLIVYALSHPLIVLTLSQRTIGSVSVP